MLPPLGGRAHHEVLALFLELALFLAPRSRLRIHRDVCFLDVAQALLEHVLERLALALGAGLRLLDFLVRNPVFIQIMSRHNVRYRHIVSDVSIPCITPLNRVQAFERSQAVEGPIHGPVQDLLHCPGPRRSVLCIASFHDVEV